MSVLSFGKSFPDERPFIWPSFMPKMGAFQMHLTICYISTAARALKIPIFCSYADLRSPRKYNLLFPNISFLVYFFFPRHVAFLPLTKLT